MTDLINLLCVCGLRYLTSRADPERKCYACQLWDERRKVKARNYSQSYYARHRAAQLEAQADYHEQHREAIAKHAREVYHAKKETA